MDYGPTNGSATLAASGLMMLIQQSETLAARAESLTAKYSERLESVMFPETPEKTAMMMESSQRPVAPSFDQIRRQLCSIDRSLNAFERLLSRLDV